MNGWSRWVAMVVGISASMGCHHVSSTSASAADVDASPAKTATAESRGVPASPVEVEVRAAQVAAAELETEHHCSHDVDGDRFYGFYRTDAWEKGEVVLTFDDGPHPTATPRVLDQLQARKLPATFFLVGRAITPATFPLVQRIVADGHSLGSHSYSHDVHMTRVETPDATVETIRGEHEVTRILIDLALLADSTADFEAMYERVFEADPHVWLATRAVRREWRTFIGRHDALLHERNGGRHAYDVIYSRPPGGGPYVQQNGAAGMKLYDRALAELGMINVMWHGASGDTHPELRSDYAYLSANLKEHSENGGVLLIHDYIRSDALSAGLDAMGHNKDIQVIPMQRAVEQKYQCDAPALSRDLREPTVADRGPLPKNVTPSSETRS